MAKQQVNSGGVEIMLCYTVEKSLYRTALYFVSTASIFLMDKTRINFCNAFLIN